MVLTLFTGLLCSGLFSMLASVVLVSSTVSVIISLGFSAISSCGFLTSTTTSCGFSISVICSFGCSGTTTSS